MTRRRFPALLGIALAVGASVPSPSLAARSAAATSASAPATPVFHSEVPIPPGYPYAYTRPDTLKIKPFTFHPPDPQREALPNGLIVYLMEDHELPTFSAIAYTKVGSIYVPMGKAGLAGITGSVMRTGGTDSRTGDEIDQSLEFVGASVESSIGIEFGTASATSLAKDTDLVLKTLADILRHPAFREEKLELARGQVLEGIRRQNDDPNQIATREFGRLVYGRDSPWAQVPTLASVKGIARQDLIDFHQKYYHPNNTILAVSGDFNPNDLMGKIRADFGDWEKEAVDYPALPPLKDVQQPHVYVVTRDLPQTAIWMGHLGERRHSPDKPAVDVLNEIYGNSGFTSRLMREVRSNRGLAYGVAGAVGVGADRGLFFAEAQTKTDSAVQAAALMKQITEGMRTQPVTEAEVRLAKESILNSYVFRFDTPFEVVSQRAQYELLGYPADYLTTYPRNIRAITPVDVKAAALKYMHPDKMVILIVGKTEGVQPPVSTLGPVSPLALESVDDPGAAK